MSVENIEKVKEMLAEKKTEELLIHRGIAYSSYPGERIMALRTLIDEELARRDQNEVEKIEEHYGIRRKEFEQQKEAWDDLNRNKREKEKYYDRNSRRYQLKLNQGTDADIIARLDKAESMQGYIKELIRKDIELDQGKRREYAIIRISLEQINEEMAKPVQDFDYDTVYRSSSAKEIMDELDRMGATEDEYSIECYYVNNEGEFVVGSDYDSLGNFRKRKAYHL